MFPPEFTASPSAAAIRGQKKILLTKDFAGIQTGEEGEKSPETAEFHCVSCAEFDCTAMNHCMAHAKLDCTCREILHIYAEILCIFPNDSKQAISISGISVVICKGKRAPGRIPGTIPDSKKGEWPCRITEK